MVSRLAQRLAPQPRGPRTSTSGWAIGHDVRMTSEQPHGVVFPLTDGEQRSTTAVGRAVIADALRPVDLVGARAAEQETGWRSSYLPHFRRAVEAGLGSREDALAIASAGLASL